MPEARLPYRPSTLETLRDTSWAAQAACLETDPEQWFIDGDPGAWSHPRYDERRADLARICAGCPVLLECRTDAVDDPHSFRGGMTPKQRRMWNPAKPDKPPKGPTQTEKGLRTVARIEAAMKENPTLTCSTLARRLGMALTGVRDAVKRCPPEVREQIRANGRAATPGRKAS